MCFFFFKQKTAYEMRISDWSSDVCSSDLGRVTTGRWPTLNPGFVAVPLSFRRSASSCGQQREECVEAIRMEAVFIHHCLPVPCHSRRNPGRIAGGARGFLAPLHPHELKDQSGSERSRYRSEGRRVGKESGSTCRYRWSP